MIMVIYAGERTRAPPSGTGGYVPNGRTERTTEEFQSESECELLLNCFIAFSEVPQGRTILGMLSTSLTRKEPF